MSRIRPVRLSRREQALRRRQRAHAIGGAADTICDAEERGAFDLDDGADAARCIVDAMQDKAIEILTWGSRLRRRPS